MIAGDVDGRARRNTVQRPRARRQGGPQPDPDPRDEHQRKVALALLALVRPGLVRPQGVDAVLHILLGGRLGSNAVRLLEEMASLRAWTAPFLHDLGHALKRATITDQELIRFRRGLKRLRRHAIRVENHCGANPHVQAIRTDVQLLDLHLRALRPPGPFLVLVRDGHLAATRQGTQAAFTHLADSLSGITVDMSAVDLTRLKAIAPDKLTDVIWTDDTRWSPPLADHVRRRSRKLAPGLYQITASPSAS